MAMNAFRLSMSQVAMLAWLAIVTPPVLVEALPPEKQAIEDQYTQERAAGSQNPAPRDPTAPFPVVPEQPFLLGILEDCNAPISPGELARTSCWQGIVSGVRTIVFAGSEGTQGNSDQGVVYVVALPGYPQPVSGARIPTPVLGGA